ncbi:SoxR reducing system RseC family protein [Anaerospora sp.]|uniref:SoxR reducing system RseC family protein n=1 Tax=Anaerospora sp. TaxID=1960278 RepID=UPI00289A7BDD|nr:SoxR reducing system RseC family protein [Anaerospora sp.]
MVKRQEGVVLEVSEKMAKVKTSRHNNCESCGACPGNSALVLDAKNPLGALPGQRVEFEIREAGMLKAAFIVFVLPLLAAFIGGTSGGWLATHAGYDAQLPEIIGGVMSFGLAVMYIKYVDVSIRSDARMQPIITRIYN